MDALTKGMIGRLCKQLGQDLDALAFTLNDALGWPEEEWLAMKHRIDALADQMAHMPLTTEEKNNARV